MLDITSPVLDYLTESQTKIVGKLTLIIAIYYGPAFLRSTKTETAVMNDFNTFKTASILSNEFDEEVGRSLKKTMSNHTEYLSPKCLQMALTDPYLDLETKIKLLNALIAYEVPRRAYRNQYNCSRQGGNHRKYKSGESNTSGKLDDVHSSWHKERGSRVL